MKRADLKRLLVPVIPLRNLPVMMLVAALGTLISGSYGILHDQITFTLAPEYFTCLKFDQFGLLESPRPPRLLAGWVGFQATWWVGCFAGWFLARIATHYWSLREVPRQCLPGILWILMGAILGGLVGYASSFLLPESASWNYYLQYGVTDLGAFIRVGMIHNGGYAGALIGLIAGIFRTTKRGKDHGLIRSRQRSTNSLDD